jgi:hypothetical protein
VALANAVQISGTIAPDAAYTASSTGTNVLISQTIENPHNRFLRLDLNVSAVTTAATSSGNSRLTLVVENFDPAGNRWVQAAMPTTLTQGVLPAIDAYSATASNVTVGSTSVAIPFTASVLVAPGLTYSVPTPVSASQYNVSYNGLIGPRFRVRVSHYDASVITTWNYSLGYTLGL